MSTLGDIMSTSEGCSVHWGDIIMHVGDIMSTSGDTMSTLHHMHHDIPPMYS